MKRLASLTLLFLIVFALGAADLSLSAEAIKEEMPVAYEVIKGRAEAEWGTDYSMVLYVINQQCDAAVEALAMVDKNPDELFDAIHEWTDGGWSEVIRILDAGGKVLDAPTDWVMVVYSASKQIEAKGKY